MSKKDRELTIVEAVRRRIAGFPGGPLDPHEAPDVLLKYSKGLVGFEVTNLYPKPIPGVIPVQAQESERRTAVDRARVRAEKSGLPPLLVTVHFHESAVLQKSDRDDLARSIADLVQRHAPKDFGMASLKDRNPGAVQLPEQVYSIGIHRLSGITRHSWSAHEGQIIADDFSDVIQGVIDEKSRDLARYLTSCDECHLVIASGIESFRPAYEASATTLAHRYQSPFARTFYIEAFGDRIVELYTTVQRAHGIA
jgi:hypothetical protein